jgi:hypothetical protein
MTGVGAVARTFDWLGWLALKSAERPRNLGV